jgi:hypothetical protein
VVDGQKVGQPADPDNTTERQSCLQSHLETEPGLEHIPGFEVSSEGGKLVNTPLRLLSIGAHPADIFDQSGGTMARCSFRLRVD